jgi:hypothetical protein
MTLIIQCLSFFFPFYIPRKTFPRAPQGVFAYPRGYEYPKLPRSASLSLCSCSVLSQCVSICFIRQIYSAIRQRNSLRMFPHGVMSSSHLRQVLPPNSKSLFPFILKYCLEFLERNKRVPAGGGGAERLNITRIKHPLGVDFR